MKRILLILISWLSAFHGELADHLKKAEGKLPIHRMRNIDFIYMINLDERPEKFAFCKAELGKYGIIPYRFSAVNGWTLPLEVINDVGLKYQPWMTEGQRGTCFLPELGRSPFYEIMSAVGRTYFCDQFFLGSIGVVMSHTSVLQDAADSDYDTVWIMEDDIEIIRDPNLLSDLIERLDALVGENGWDILFTDRDTKDKKGNYVPCISYAKRPNFIPSHPERFAVNQQIGLDFRKIGARYGAYSMIVRKSGVKKLLAFMKAHQVFLPYDMDMTLPNTIRLFTVLDDVVSTQPRAPTDNGAPNYRWESNGS